MDENEENEGEVFAYIFNNSDGSEGFIMCLSTKTPEDLIKNTEEYLVVCYGEQGHNWRKEETTLYQLAWLFDDQVG